MSIRKIGIIGTGGVGGYFGAKLCQLRDAQPDLEVSFLARGAHLERILKDGLKVKMKGETDLVVRPDLATDKIAEMGELDLVLVCVKEYDLSQVLQALCKVTHDKTLILPLLNGVDVPERIRRVMHHGVVFPACVYIGTHIEQPGVISQKGGACKILMGQDPDHAEFNPSELLQLFTSAEIKHEWTSDIASRVWEKFIFIAGYGLVTATHAKTIGEVLEDADLKQTVMHVMQETADLANGLGVKLEASIVQQSRDKGTQFPPETKTSFQRDFEITDKPDERELFAGAILEIGERLKIDTPHTRRLYRIVNEQKPVFWR